MIEKYVKSEVCVLNEALYNEGVWGTQVFLCVHGPLGKSDFNLF
jgi:hypothetical protein